jgi:hypothetical protein
MTQISVDLRQSSCSTVSEPNDDAVTDCGATLQASVHTATAVSGKERISEMNSEFADENRASTAQHVNNHVLTELPWLPRLTGNHAEVRSEFIIGYR